MRMWMRAASSRADGRSMAPMAPVAVTRCAVWYRRCVGLDEVLPAELRGATLTKIAAGMSGAGVYRVEADGRTFVLKTGARNLDILRAAAAAAVAPPAIHIDEARG